MRKPAGCASATRVRYRLAHLPIWIWVFFLAPGPLTFDLFAHGGSGKNLAWLLLVIVATGIAGYFGQLPGVEPRPYILRFTEDKPNPLYRKICYTFAWNAVITFTLLNLAGLVIAVVSGQWVMKQIYLQAYFPLCAVVLLLGLLGLLPRVGRSTKGEGIERRYFYGAVWAAVISQTLLLRAVEDAAPVSGDEPDQAGSVRAESMCGGCGCCFWDASADAAYRSRTTNGRGLELRPLRKSLRELDGCPTFASVPRLAVGQYVGRKRGFSNAFYPFHTTFSMGEVNADEGLRPSLPAHVH